MSFFSKLWSHSPKEKTPQTEESRLRDLLMRTVSVEQCVEIYRQALPDSALEKDARAKITKLAHTFIDWQAVVTGLPNEDVLFASAIESMFRLAGTCPQMETVVRLCPPHISIRESALNVLVEKAKSFDEWLLIFSLALSGSELSKRAEAEVEKHATTISQWEEIWNRTTDPILELKALEKRLEKSATLSELSLVYADAPEGSPIEKQIEERFALVDASFAELLSFYENGDDDQNKHKCFMEIVLRRLLAVAPDHHALISIYGIAHEADQEDEIDAVLEELGRSVLDKETWEKIRKDAGETSPLENYVLRKLIVMCGDSVPELLALYIEYVGQTDTDTDVAEDMITAILDKATPSEQRIIAQLADCDQSLGDLASRAEEKFSPKPPPVMAVT